MTCLPSKRNPDIVLLMGLIETDHLKKAKHCFREREGLLNLPVWSGGLKIVSQKLILLNKKPRRAGLIANQPFLLRFIPVGLIDLGASTSDVV